LIFTKFTNYSTALRVGLPCVPNLTWIRHEYWKYWYKFCYYCK